MNVSSKITQKLAALLIMTAGVYLSSEFADSAFVRAASETSLANLEVGQPAPDFTLPDTNGKTQTLSKYRGKLVVLEWLNFDCPFVQRHYQVGNMQSLQKTYTAKGVVWLSIISSAEGRGGYGTNEEHNARTKKAGAAPTAVLVDSDGKVGHLYGARTTPDMYIIDKQGNLAYSGAIDDNPQAEVEHIKSARNFVREALDKLLVGKAPLVASSKPYGCGVKYKKHRRGSTDSGKAADVRTTNKVSQQP